MTPDQQPVTRQDLTDLEARIVEAIAARLDRAMTAVADEFSDLRAEMGRRFDQVERRIDAVETHIERIDTRMAATAIELAGIHKALDTGDRNERQILSTQQAQQRAIDDLYAKIAELNRRLDQPRQQN